MCDAEPFQTHWHLKSLRSGEAASRIGDVVVPSASTRKISIMMAALKAVNEGRFQLDQPVEMLAKYQDNDSGCFQHLTPGFTITFRDALVMMIIVSDNTCTGTVADMVGLDEINAFCREIGMRQSIHRYGLPPRGGPQTLDAITVTTAEDVGLLLEMILAGAKDEAAAARLGSTPELCRLGLQILAWQKLNTRMPSLLPQGTVVMHKTGTGSGVYNDSGIVCQGKEPLFVLCCYTTGVPVELAGGTPGFAAAANLIGRLARAGYDFLKE
jgi:beta-lactamase class A